MSNYSVTSDRRGTREVARPAAARTVRESEMHARNAEERGSSRNSQGVEKFEISGGNVGENREAVGREDTPKSAKSDRKKRGKERRKKRRVEKEV